MWLLLCIKEKEVCSGSSHISQPGVLKYSQLSLSVLSDPCIKQCGLGHEPTDAIRHEGEKRSSCGGWLVAARQPWIYFWKVRPQQRSSGESKGREVGGGWITDLWNTKWWKKCLACDTCHYASGKWWFLWRSESIVSFIGFFKLKLWNHHCFSQDTPPRISAPTPTIVRPGSLPLHLGFDALQPTMPSPTSVITQAPPSNRTSLGWVLLVTHAVGSCISTSEILPGWWTIPPFCLSCISLVLRPATIPWWCFPLALPCLCSLVPCTYPLSSM